LSLDHDRLFRDNLEWAAAVARNVHRKVPPSFDLADLEQVARIEMWKRVLLYEADNGRPGRDPHGTPFRAYAHMYVRGAALMFARRRAWKDGTAEAISEREVDPALRPDEQIERRQEAKNVFGPRL
jgi:DNA-directed RNA polymerase specialized sigma subunit